MIIRNARPQSPEKKGLDSHGGYHKFHAHETDDLHGCFEVFWSDGGEFNIEENDEAHPPGWYWWACFPGCMPDGEPTGPFPESSYAFYDADEFHPDNLDDGCGDDRDPLLDDRAAGYQ